MRCFFFGWLFILSEEGRREKRRAFVREARGEEEETRTECQRDRSLFLFFLFPHLVARSEPHRLLGEPLGLVYVPALQGGKRGLAAALGRLPGRGLAHLGERGKEENERKVFFVLDALFRLLCSFFLFLLCMRAERLELSSLSR